MLLAIDTSTRFVGIALYNGIQVLSEEVWTSREFHTVELAPAVLDMMARAKMTLGDLKVIAVALGPGSFTGLRIGLALAKGMALAGHLDLVGVSTLDVLASAQFPKEKRLAAVIQAGRGRLAVGWYKNVAGKWKQSEKIEIVTGQELANRITEPTLVCGELTDEERRLLIRKRKNVILASPAHSSRRPSFLAELGWQRWRSGQRDDPAALAPIYLHFREPTPG